MRITDLLSKESIRLDGVSSTKKETIRAMADLMEKSGKISDKNAYVEGLIKKRGRKYDGSRRGYRNSSL